MQPVVLADFGSAGTRAQRIASEEEDEVDGGMTAFVRVAVLVLALAAGMARAAPGQSTTVGNPVVVEGTIAMSIEDDFQSGRATRHYFLDESGLDKRYDLRLTPRQAAIVQPRMRVRVSGSLTGSVLTADQTEDGVVVLDSPGVVPPGGER